MKKKLLVLLITVIPALMPNLASAVAIDVGDVSNRWFPDATDAEGAGSFTYTPT